MLLNENYSEINKNRRKSLGGTLKDILNFNKSQSFNNNINQKDELIDKFINKLEKNDNVTLKKIFDKYDKDKNGKLDNIEENFFISDVEQAAKFYIKSINNNFELNNDEKQELITDIKNANLLIKILQSINFENENGITYEDFINRIKSEISNYKE
jgi:hypothetical protein